MRTRLLRSLCAAAIVAAATTASLAAPIVYDGTLGNLVTEFGAVPSTSSVADPLTADYWTFFGNAGDVVTITVGRLEDAFDPALWVFEGVFADTSAFGVTIDVGDAGFLDFADDELPPAIAGPFGDPESTIVLTLPGTGQYTVAVTSFSSGADDGDGLFPYSITARGVVPEPSTLALFGLGLAALGGIRLRRRAAA